MIRELVLRLSLLKETLGLILTNGYYFVAN